MRLRLWLLVTVIVGLLLVWWVKSYVPPPCLVAYVLDQGGKQINDALYLLRYPDKPQLLGPTPQNGKAGFGGTIRDPVFSPDGRQILFVANRSGTDVFLLYGSVPPDSLPTPYIGTDIWLLDIGSRKARLLTKEGYGYEEPAWSPDGRRVVAVHNPSLIWEDGVAREDSVLLVLDIRSLHRTVLWRGRLGRSGLRLPKWSPDGNSIAFLRNGSLCTISLRTRKTRSISADVVGFDWHPSARAIAYCTAKVAYVTSLADGSRSQVINARGSNSFVAGPRWNPVGSRIYQPEVRWATSVDDRSPVDETVPIVTVFRVTDWHGKLQRASSTEWVHRAEVVSWADNGRWLVVSGNQNPCDWRPYDWYEEQWVHDDRTDTWCKEPPGIRVHAERYLSICISHGNRSVSLTPKDIAPTEIAWHE